MVTQVDWQHCQEDTTNPKSAKSSQEFWRKSKLLLLSQYHEWLTFSFCSFNWFNNRKHKSTQIQQWLQVIVIVIVIYTIIWLKTLKIKTSVNNWVKPLVISSDWRKMESQDYEHHRNLTLMFFFEKLLEKGGKFVFYIFLIFLIYSLFELFCPDHPDHFPFKFDTRLLHELALTNAMGNTWNRNSASPQYLKFFRERERDAHQCSSSRVAVI